jgi:glycosyltransferase involved in cell wall biosynthesis
MRLVRLSILIPVFNEARTLRELLAQVDAAAVAGLEKELIIVDDGSTDGTREILERPEGLQTPFRVVFHGQNMGKGAAVRTALTYATGDLILIQDADLEYDPRDYEELLDPILRGRADVVYGSRLRGGKPVQDFSLLYLWGNKFVTLVTNVLYGAALTDMETGYKLFRADVIKNIQIRANRFDFEPEVTAKILKRGYKLVELPISYYGRPHAEGKKLTWRDGFAALWTLVKYRFVD